MSFAIAALEAGSGRIGICPAPGRFGDYASDFKEILAWGPRLVLSMTETPELGRVGAAGFADDLAMAGIGRIHLPIRDFGAPMGRTACLWPESAGRARAVLAQGGGVLVHCFGGCGRSGMAVMRLLVEMGEEPEAALARLRAVRPCAVETEAQADWASNTLG
ncbi:protein phosphatase [Shimia aestuarii]|uniref:phosphatase domain-containing putative toxin n=1 Tax=Shimia aestuarii TaxID=254406 RepID=UPI001FB42B77|nr:protein phosphatase [Shimia aestuarii]